MNPSISPKTQELLCKLLILAAEHENILEIKRQALCLNPNFLPYLLFTSLHNYSKSSIVP